MDVLFDAIGNLGPGQFIHIFFICVILSCNNESFYFAIFFMKPITSCVSTVEQLQQDSSDGAIHSQNLFKSEYCTLENEQKCSYGDIFYNQTYPYRSIISSEYKLECDRAFLRSVGGSMLGVGYLMGSFVFGQLSDRFGRRKCVMITVFLKSLSMFIVPHVGNLNVVIFLFFCIAFFGYGTYIAAYVLLVELVGSSKRISVLICQEISGMFADFMTLYLFYLTMEWRTCLAVHSIILLSVSFLVFCITESPLWLLSQQKFQEAMNIIINIANKNRKPVSPSHLHTLLEPYKQADYHQTMSTHATAIDVFRNPNTCKKALIIFLNWITVVSCYYAVYFNMASLHSDLFISYLISNILGLPQIVFGFLALRLFGRRITFVVILFSGSMTGLAILFLAKSDFYFLILSLLGKFFFAMAFIVVYMWSSEIYPTPVRSVAMGMSSFCGRIGLLSVPYALQYGLFAQACITSLALVAAVFSMFLPETSQRSLPQTIEESEEIELRRFDELLQYHGDSNRYRKVTEDNLGSFELESEDEIFDITDPEKSTMENAID